MSDPIFQRTLQDLIKGIRSNKKDPAPFINKSISETKAELRSTDPFIKAEAVRKLTYLQMIGYNVSWASFAIVEVMSQPRFGHKRIGYLAANQSFNEDTDVILLTTNLYKKELVSNHMLNQYEIGLAINSLANISTKDLARDCMPDLVTLMNHSRPYIRKKAVLAMYKLYVKFPQGLRLTFDKLKERLDDAESSVVSTAVNVICELANKNPRNYLAMAPKFFKLLTTSSNNWMLIKVVKLLGSLVSEEPRLARKLLEPLSTIIQNTGAKSLQYECIYTVTEALPYSKREDGSDAKNAPAVIKLCSDYLRSFIEDSDQNLKYLGLVGLVKLMVSSPRSVVEHRDLVLRCLNDDDVTIRTKALELLVGIVSRKSLVDLVHHLLEHARLAEGRYRDEIISKILQMCKRDKYSLVNDFAWYTSILLELAVMQGSKHGREVADQLIEIALRVDSVRSYAVETMLSMLLNDGLVLGQARLTVSEVLKAAAWIVGEYSNIVTLIAQDDAPDDAEDGNAFWIEGATGEDIRSEWRGQPVHQLAIDALLHPRATNLPEVVQMGYLHAAMKLFVRAANSCKQMEMAAIVGIVREKIPVFMQSQNLEIQERATTFRYLLAEMDILPMNWEEKTVEVTKPGSGPAAVANTQQKVGGVSLLEESGLDEKQKQIMDLLDLPVYTRSSVQAIDDAGASNAIAKRDVLQTFVAEVFYAVHSKAQRRVPIPEDLSLDDSFNDQALNDLLAVEIPEDVSMNMIELIRSNRKSGHAFNLNREEERLASTLGSTFEDAAAATAADATFGVNRTYGDASDDDHNGVDSGVLNGSHAAPHRNPEDDIFMLSSGGNKNIIPLSKVLGDTFEDVPTRKSSSKQKDKKKKKKSATSVNVNEMLPAGALSSDDDMPVKRNSSKRTGKNSVNVEDSHSGSVSRKKKSGKQEKDDDDLTKVDITTPLRDDEKLVERQHHVVPDVQPAIAEVGDGGVPKKKKKSSKQTDVVQSKKKTSSKKSKNISGSVQEVGDLLSDDVIAAPTSQDSENLLGLDFGLTQSVPAGSSGRDEEAIVSAPNAPSGSKKASMFWQQLSNDQGVDVLYAVGTMSNAGASVKLHWKVVNKSSDGSSATVEVAYNGAGLAVHPHSDAHSPLVIADGLSGGKDKKTSIDVNFVAPLGDRTLEIQCQLTTTTETMMGPSSLKSSSIIIIPVSVTFFPRPLDDAAFAQILTRVSSMNSGIASTSIRVPYGGKAKSAFKALASFLRAHPVELESSKAASLAAIAPGNLEILVLLKAMSSAGVIQVDIKCASSDGSRANAVASSITKSLSGISL